MRFFRKKKGKGDTPDSPIIGNELSGGLQNDLERIQEDLSQRLVAVDAIIEHESNNSASTNSMKKRKDYEELKKGLESTHKMLDKKLQELKSNSSEKSVVAAQKEATKIQKQVNKDLKEFDSVIGESEKLMIEQILATRRVQNLTKDAASGDAHVTFVPELSLTSRLNSLLPSGALPGTDIKCTICMQNADVERLIETVDTSKDMHVKVDLLRAITAMISCTASNPRCRLQLCNDVMDFKLLDKLAVMEQHEQDTGSNHLEFTRECTRLREALDSTEDLMAKTSDPAHVAILINMLLKKHTRARFLQVLLDLEVIAEKSIDQNWATLERIMKKLINSMDEHGKIIDESDEKILELENEVVRIRLKRDQAKEEITTLGTQIENYKKQLKEVKDDMEKLQVSNAQLEKQMVHLRTELQNPKVVTVSDDDTKLKLAELEKQVAALTNEKVTLVKEHDEKVKSLEQKVKTSAEELEKAKLNGVNPSTPTPTEVVAPVVEPQVEAIIAPPPPPPPMIGGPPPPPPPPGMGGPPGPPPPPGMGGPPPPGMGPPLPKLTVHDPKVNMRNLHMDTIPKGKLAKSVFLTKGIAENTTSVELNLEELEKLFGVEAKKTKDLGATGGGEGAPVKEKAPEAVTLLDSKRGYNINIQLTSLRMTTFQIKDAVIMLDPKRMSIEQIGILSAIAPTPEEVKLVDDYDGDIKLLAKPERFFVDMRIIPYLGERLDAWAFKIKFETDISLVAPDIEILRKAATEMQSSEKLFGFLTVVLALSNFLNAKSRYKQTYGFKLSTLAKLRDTKSSDNKSNLLDYLVGYLNKNHADDGLCEFYDDLEYVQRAQKVSLASIKESISSLQGNLGLLNTTIGKYEKLGTDQRPHGDRFLEDMVPFAEEAKERLKQLSQDLDSAMQAVTALVEMYDEEPVMIQKPETFFGMINAFVQDYKNCRKETEEAKKKEEEKKKLAEKKGAMGGGMPVADTQRQNTMNLMKELQNIKRNVKQESNAEVFKEARRRGSVLQRHGESTPPSVPTDGPRPNPFIQLRKTDGPPK